MNIPSNLKFAKSHEWIRVEGEEAFIGISEYATSELGEISFIDIDPDRVGEDLSKNDSFGVIEAVKTVTDVYMPVSGQLLEVNQEVLDNPVNLEKDCYGKGWLIKISVKDSSELSQLLDAEAYKEIAKH